MSVFSPLALTQTLPFLPLAQGDIDYEVARRGEPDLFAKVLAEPATKVILVKDGKVAVPHGQGAIADYANVKMRLAQLPGAYVAAELESHPSALAIFLGSYGGRLGEHVVAVDVTHVQPNDTTITAATARSGGRSAGARIAGKREIAAGKRGNPIRLGGPARIRAPRQRTRSRTGNLRHLAQHVARPVASLPDVRRARRTGARRLGSALHERRGWQSFAVPPNRASGDHRDRRP